MIETNGLTKHYGALRAVDDLSFSVQPGEVLGFLGPNGAGKSTTMKMLAGFVPPTSGTAKVAGFDVASDPVSAKSRLGYLPEGAPSYPEMTPIDFLHFIGRVRQMSQQTIDNRLQDVVSQLHLEPVLGQTIDTLSKGYKRRVGLAQAILHDPEVLILDEPTDGLDPNQKREVRQLINSMAENKLIVISTHILEEVDAVCNRAIIIAHGKILADDTPANLQRRSRYHNAVRVGFAAQDTLLSAKGQIANLTGVADVELDEDNKTITAFAEKGSESLLQPITELCLKSSWNITDLRQETGRLDEVFRSITGGASA